MEKSREDYLEKVWDSLDPQPWQVREEFLAFLKFILDNDIKTILEIGCHRGGSASAFLAIGCKVVSVDIIKQPEIVALQKNPNFKFFLRSEFDLNLDEDYMHFDMLWIDGDHSYEGCKQDVIEYAPLVARENGYLAFHDTVKSDLHKTQQCEVWKVIDELIKEQHHKEHIKFITDRHWGGIELLKY